MTDRDMQSGAEGGPQGKEHREPAGAGGRGGGRARLAAMLFAALASLALLAVGGGAWWLLARTGQQEGSGTGPPRPPLVRTAAVRAAGDVAITQTGFVRPVFEVEVTPEISARIARLGDGFRVGGRVARGDPLVLLDRDRLEADLAEAEARVGQARAAVTEARVARRRQEDLEDEDFASEARLQDAILGVSRAEAELAAARASETRARQRLEDATLRAPFDALVTARAASPGQAVAPGAVLGTLVATGAAQIRLGLTGRDEALIGGAEAALGTAVTVLPAGPADAGPLGEGVVTDTDPRVAEGSRTTGLIVRVEDAFAPRDPRPLRVGELVELRLAAELGGSGALSVPAEALKAGAALWRIVPADDGATLARVPAAVIYRAAGKAVFTAEGLGPGDRVMLSDRAGALDGLRVRLADMEEAGTQGGQSLAAGASAEADDVTDPGGETRRDGAPSGTPPGATTTGSAASGG